MVRRFKAVNVVTNGVHPHLAQAEFSSEKMALSDLLGQVAMRSWVEHGRTMCRRAAGVVPHYGILLLARTYL